MKYNIVILISFLFCSSVFSQDISYFKFYQLNTDDLKKEFPDLEEVNINELNLCIDNNIEDIHNTEKIRYSSKKIPGIIFEAYIKNKNITKIYLTDNYGGNFPLNIFFDNSLLKLKNFTENNELPKDCLNYKCLSGKNLYFLVETNKNGTPKHTIYEYFYEKRTNERIDRIIDYFYEDDTKNSNNVPLFLVNGRETIKNQIKNILLEHINVVTILKGDVAKAVYGTKGKNGVVVIALK